MGGVVDSLTGRAARKQARKQREIQEGQRVREEQRLAEEESEVARRQAAAQSGRAGRRSLIRTSEMGVTGSRTTLG